jgi:hypothetical protein
MKVIVETSERRRRSGEIGSVGDVPRYMYQDDTQSRLDVGRG